MSAALYGSFQGGGVRARECASPPRGPHDGRGFPPASLYLSGTSSRGLRRLGHMQLPTLDVRHNFPGILKELNAIDRPILDRPKDPFPDANAIPVKPCPPSVKFVSARRRRTHVTTKSRVGEAGKCDCKGGSAQGELAIKKNQGAPHRGRFCCWCPPPMRLG